MKAPRGSRVIDVDVFHCEVLVLFNQTQINQFIKINNLKSDTIGNADGTALQFVKDDEAPFLVMASKGWSFSTLAHESVHIAHFILDNAGVPINMENTEIVAYLTQHLFVSVADRLELSSVKTKTR